MHRSLLLLIILLISTPLLSAPLTLESAISDGVSHSPALRRSNLAIDELMARRDEVVARSSGIQLNGAANHIFSKKYAELEVPFGDKTVSFPTIFPSSTLGINITAPLYNGATTTHELAALDAAIRAAQLDRDGMRFHIEQDIRISFYRIIAAKKIRDVMAFKVTVLDEQFKQISAQKRDGSATNYDVLHVQVQQNEARLDLADANDAILDANQRLITAMGLATDNRDVTGNLPLVTTVKIPPSTNSAFENRFDIRSINERISAINEYTRAETPEWYLPTVSLDATGDLYNTINDAVVDPAFKSSYHIGIGARWILFDSGCMAAKTQRNAVIAASQRAGISDILNHAKADFDIGKRRWISSINRAEVKELDCKRREEGIRLIKIEEKAGTRTHTEVLDAQANWFNAQAAVVSAQLAAIEAMIMIENSIERTVK